MIWAQKRSTPVSFPPLRLEGCRVMLRPPVREDWVQWSRVRTKNNAFLKPFEPASDEGSLTLQSFERRLLQQMQSWAQGRSCSFLIFKNSDLIGGMNINGIMRGAAQHASLGYWIDEGHQGQGYMAESLQLALEFCFHSLVLHRVHAACIPHNHRSANLLLRAGFQEEGFAEKYIEIDGLWQDHRLFGLPVDAWKKSKISAKTGEPV